MSYTSTVARSCIGLSFIDSLIPHQTRCRPPGHGERKSLGTQTLPEGAQGIVICTRETSPETRISSVYV